METWKAIPRFMGEYEVSSLGRVRSIDRIIKRKKTSVQVHGKMLKIQTDKAGYKYVVIHNRLNLVHRLVCETFLPNPKETVNHKNGNKSDNRIENLEWATRSENTKHSYAVLGRKGSHSGIRGDKNPLYGKVNNNPKRLCVLQSKDGEIINSFHSLREAERITKVPHTHISNVCKGKTATAGGYYWSFKTDVGMIITNGTLQVVEKTGGGMVNGKPVPVTEAIGDPIPCNIKTLTDNKKGKIIDNVFTQSSYEVLIDTLAIPHFMAETVILTDNRGVVKGKFRVQDIQHLDYVEAVKITV